MSGGPYNNSPFVVLCCAGNSFTNIGTECMSKRKTGQRIAVVDRNENQIVKDSVLKGYSIVIATPGLIKDRVFQIWVKEGAVLYSVLLVHMQSVRCY